MYRTQVIYNKSVSVILLFVLLQATGIFASGGDEGGNTGDGDQGSGWDGTAFFLSTLVMSLYCLLKCACPPHNPRIKRWYRFIRTVPRIAFDVHAANAKKEVDKSNETETCIPSSNPISGLYEVTSIEGCERGVFKTSYSTKSIEFKQTRFGWNIEGNGTDKNGSFIVEVGYASNDGTAFWIEDHKSSVQKVLNRGKFDFKMCTFVGSWRTCCGKVGTYEGFKLKQELPKIQLTEGEEFVSGKTESNSTNVIPHGSDTAINMYSPPSVPSMTI